MSVFSGGTIAGNVLPDATGRNLGALAQLWNAFIQICTFGGATSGSTQLKASAIASGVLTLPAATDTLVGKATTDTLTNKTLTTPTISQPLLVGVTDGSAAATGNVGEFVRTKQATPQSLTSTVILSLGSISLTAGDWDIQANAVFSGSSTTITFAAVAISTSSSAISPQDNSFENEAATCFITATAIASGHAITTPTFRVSITSTTSYFLLTQATFASNAVSVAGTIRARRVR